MNEQHLDRRLFLRAGTAAGAALTVGTAAGAQPAAAAPGGFPDYTYVRTLLTATQLKYNPTNEIIFPCVRGVYDKLGSPLGRYYLYYAPHDPPGGICLAYGDSLEGPFTEYPSNPIVSNKWAGHYSVTHVSSPHVLWNQDAKEFWLYFHGENTTTRSPVRPTASTSRTTRSCCRRPCSRRAPRRRRTPVSSVTTCRRAAPAT